MIRRTRRKAASPWFPSPTSCPTIRKPDRSRRWRRKPPNRATRCCARWRKWKTCASAPAREVADARTYGITGFARDVLDIADNLQRALDAVPAEAKASADPGLKALIEGVELTERSLLNTLEKNGVKKFDPSGEKFDPNFQQAMYEVPDPSVPAGTVVQVVQAGYMIGERVLRPALVAVSKGGAKAAPAWQLAEHPPEIPKTLIPPGSDPERFAGDDLNRDIARLDALDAGLGHVGPGLGERALGVDAAAGVFDDIGFEAGLARIERGPGTQKSVPRPATNSRFILRALR